MVSFSTQILNLWALITLSTYFTVTPIFLGAKKIGKKRKLRGIFLNETRKENLEAFSGMRRTFNEKDFNFSEDKVHWHYMLIQLL